MVPCAAGGCSYQADPTRPSEGLEYTYARKTSALDHERRSLAHIWELGGNGPLGAAASGSDQLFLTYRQVGVCGGWGRGTGLLRYPSCTLNPPVMVKRVLLLSRVLEQQVALQLCGGRG
jgi:hypothetical protein